MEAPGGMGSNVPDWKRSRRVLLLQFIPRKDWVTYLTYELPDKAPGHEHLLQAIYISIPTEQEVDGRFKRLSEALSWMSTYCWERRWIN